MSLRTTADIIGEVLVRNNRTTTDSFITDAMLQDWLRDANNYSTTQYKWPLSEVRDQSTAWAGQEEVPYTDFTVDFKADAIRILQIGGKRLEKKNFEDYMTFREEQPSNNARIFTDFARTLYINPYADLSGTIAAFGQYTPQLDPTDATATTIFSNFDEEGNEAIVEKMTSYIKRREHLPDEAELHDQRTDAVLQKLWVKIQAEQYKYQTGPSTDGMFKRFDILRGGYREDLFNRDQFQ
jgi:hypothetical protein